MLLSDSLRPPSPTVRLTQHPPAMPAWHLQARLGPPANFESEENSIVYIITKSPLRYLDVVEKNDILLKITVRTISFRPQVLPNTEREYPSTSH